MISVSKKRPPWKEVYSENGRLSSRHGATRGLEFLRRADRHPIRGLKDPHRDLVQVILERMRQTELAARGHAGLKGEEPLVEQASADVDVLGRKRLGVFLEDDAFKQAVRRRQVAVGIRVRYAVREHGERFR